MYSYSLKDKNRHLYHHSSLLIYLSSVDSLDIVTTACWYFNLHPTYSFIKTNLYFIIFPSRHKKIAICSENAPRTHRTYALRRSCERTGETGGCATGDMSWVRTENMFWGHTRRAFWVSVSWVGYKISSLINKKYLHYDK